MKFFVAHNYNDMSKTRDNRKETVFSGVSLHLLVNVESAYVVYKEKTLSLAVVL